MRRAVLVAGMSLLLAGCSTTSLTGVPAEKVLTKAELYDPCTLPLASLSALGLDSKTVSADFFGVPDPEWHLCLWRGPSFFLTVLSTTNSFRAVKDNPRNEELRDVTVAGRQAIEYFDVGDPSRYECDIAFATAAGVVIVRSRVDEWETLKQNPCDVAQSSTAALNPEFPR